MVKRTGDDAHVFRVTPFAFHCVRLATAGLSLREDGPVLP